MQQLGGLDAAFLSCETATMHMHVCGLAILDASTLPGGYDPEAVRREVASRVREVPEMRRRLLPVPFNLGRPFWLDDDRVDLDRHFHQVRLPAPGDDHELARLVGEVASHPLRRDRPLWEFWVVEGLARNRFALLVKMHHSVIDGVAGANVLGHLFDTEPPPGPPTRRPDGRPRPARRASTAPDSSARIGRAPPSARRPSPAELVARSLAQRLAEPWELARLVPKWAGRAASTAWDLARGGANGAVTVKPFTAPRLPWNASLTPRRCVAFTDLSLDDMKAVKRSFDVTVNDVVGAVVGGALRRTLEDHGVNVDRPVIVAQPVSVHAETDIHLGVARLSVMFGTLATDEADPVQRLRTVAAGNARSKEIHRLVGADVLVEWSRHFWPNGFSLGARLYSGLHLAEHHVVVHNLILSNVPGPPMALYFAGARLLGVYPLGPITDGAGLNITVVSQEDRVGFGIISCPDLFPDVWDLAAALGPALAELVDRAPDHAKAKRPRPAAGRDATSS